MYINTMMIVNCAIFILEFFFGTNASIDLLTVTEYVGLVQNKKSTS